MINHIYSEYFEFLGYADTEEETNYLHGEEFNSFCHTLYLNRKGITKAFNKFKEDNPNSLRGFDDDYIVTDEGDYEDCFISSD